ncbi:MAG: DNA gyrase subunit A [Candidatus Saganbacteria bacterium]|nr:DNA gyrase subunit A [Candidatus Saganbacteria bacterium]
MPRQDTQKIIGTSLEEEMKTSYLDYSMSVIVGRALPDARDGLKPVHRRILFAMDELGLQPGKPYKKSARVVGEVLGKYHPHGDTAVYDAMVRMAQDFSMRGMLVDGQGNFGSVDGDSPAAMRYTEARLSHLAIELLADLEKETVDFGPNFDDSLQEPLVLPAKFPNLLVNGSSGIAVGMATNIPPHNLGEVIDGAIALIENPDTSIEELSKYIKGPDFPTGAMICGKAGIKEAYATGRGSIKLRAKVEFEPAKNGKEAIIVTELPYQVNKSQLVSRIADLVKDKKIKNIADLRDESDRKGMRIYIELKRDTPRDLVLNQLFKHTDMASSFGINMVALVDGAPRQLNLKELLEIYLKHREEVVTRRTKYELKKAEERAHILEGLLIAVKNIDAVVQLIKKSKSVDDARKGLMQKFHLSQIQAQAILDMRLQRLTQLETYKLEEEYKELKKLIADLKKLLASRKLLLELVKKELLEVKEKHQDPRRTQLVKEAEEIDEEELIPDEEVAIFITRDGYVKRTQSNFFRSQQRGGRGVAGMNTREEDEIEQIFVASTHAVLLFFSNKGKVYRVKAYDLPESSRGGKGQSIANFLELTMGEVVKAAIPVTDFNAKNAFLVMCTSGGVIKKTELNAFANIRRTGIAAIKLKGEDELRWVKQSNGSEDVIIGTKNGLMIRFPEKDVRPMGRTASGVKGISLRKGDKAVSMDVVTGNPDLLMVSADGYGKRMKIKEFEPQKRGGKGHIAMKLRDKDEVAALCLISSEDELLFVSSKGTMTRQTAEGISAQGRYAKGTRLQRMDEGDYLVNVARVVTPVEKDEEKSS